MIALDLQWNISRICTASDYHEVHICYFNVARKYWIWVRLHVLEFI